MEELKLSGEGLYNLMKSFFTDGLKFKIKLVCPGFSMSPFIRHESLLTLKPFDVSQQPRFGDVVSVAVHKHKKIIIHRIISVKPPDYLLKGDNNKVSDGWFHKKDILGLVEKINFKNKEYTPRHWQNVLIGAASKSGVLNQIILPAGRHLKHLIK
ncbi:MAG: hypothetical protein KKE44_21295 [Proteobacteria bacterium]|nr:hypothetical protein [Pseudomonadota bacterium]MBU1585269.1 hypothetical protein [Pseudomonadota bacterium]MBU2455515.1 hypothetical protein [Pseudomonadota bacterium]MBU2626987.1 hypothetical protein [Pseudomonadota bacterium]